MNIFRLSFRNIISRPLSTTLSLVLLSLGVGIISLLLQVSHHIQEQMENNVRGIDMVVGAKGSPLQLILSAVYHIDNPTGNIPLKDAERLKQNPLVESTIPLSYGDNYQGYRIVGTNHNYPNLYKATVASGRLWEKSFEVTIGATLEKYLELKLGDTFVGMHGFGEGGDVHGDHEYKVVGILAPTNSVLDQLILTATESVWDVHNHEGHEHSNEANNDHEEEHEHEGQDHNYDHEEEHKHEGEHDHDGEHEHSHEHEEEAKEITAMLVKFRNPMGIIQLPRMVNENTNMQAAVPSYEIYRLFSLMGVGIDTLTSIALIIMIVSGLSVFISLYNALKDRRYEMALMRTYGANRWQLVWLVLQESLLLTFTGYLLGVVFSRLGLWIVSELMDANYHYEFSSWNWIAEEGWLLITAIAIGLASSLLPSIQVFRINISKTLSNI